MSAHDPKVTLSQLATYAGRAQEFCKLHSLPEIVGDWQLSAAFERIMEVLGETANRLPASLTARHTSVDWRSIKGMRNRISHGYDAVDHDILWQAVKLRIPGLLTAVEQMQRELDSDQSA